MNDPWIFRRVNHYLEYGELIQQSNVSERLDCGLRHLELLSEEVGIRFALLNMRKFFGWYSRGAKGGAQFRREVFLAETIEDVHTVVKKFLETLRDIGVSEHTHSLVEL